MKKLTLMITIVLINFVLFFGAILIIKATSNKNTNVNELIPTDSPLATITILPTITVATTTGATPLVKQPTSQQIAKPTAVSVQPTKDTRCIITVFGGRYDVTQLRFSHSGGNVFICGADNTSIYQQQHGTSVQLISRYKI